MNETKTPLKDLTIQTVASVYSGAANACCCGCKGNHWRSSSHPGDTSYQKVNDRQVARVLNILKAAEAAGEMVEDFGSHYAVERGTRVHIVYLP